MEQSTLKRKKYSVDGYVTFLLYVAINISPLKLFTYMLYLCNYKLYRVYIYKILYL